MEDAIFSKDELYELIHAANEAIEEAWLTPHEMKRHGEYLKRAMAIINRFEQSKA